MKEALLLIDVQKGFHDPFWGKRNNPSAEKVMENMLNQWRLRKKPVIHIQHCSESPNSPLCAGQLGCDFQDGVTPQKGEQIFQKSVNSAFIGTGLDDYLKLAGITKLVIAGLTTDHCVSTTTRMAGNMGYQVKLVADGCATFDKKGLDGQIIDAETIHQIHLASLNDEFCQVIQSDQLLDS